MPAQLQACSGSGIGSSESASAGSGAAAVLEAPPLAMPPPAVPVLLVAEAPLLVSFTDTLYGVRQEVEEACVRAYAGSSCPSNGGLSAGAGAGIGVAATLGAVLCVLGLSRWIGSLRAGHRTLTLAVRPPGATPATTLLITDIMNSTNLWEALPPGVMNEALRLHHRCLRGLLPKCNGWGDGGGCGWMRGLVWAEPAKPKLPVLTPGASSRATGTGTGAHGPHGYLPSGTGMSVGPGALMSAVVWWGLVVWVAATPPCAVTCMAARLVVWWQCRRTDHWPCLRLRFRVRMGLHTGIPLTTDVAFNHTTGHMAYSGGPLKPPPPPPPAWSNGQDGSAGTVLGLGTGSQAPEVTARLPLSPAGGGGSNAPPPVPPGVLLASEASTGVLGDRFVAVKYPLHYQRAGSSNLHPLFIPGGEGADPAEAGAAPHMLEGLISASAAHPNIVETYRIVTQLLSAPGLPAFVVTPAAVVSTPVATELRAGTGGKVSGDSAAPPPLRRPPAKDEASGETDGIQNPDSAELILDLLGHSANDAAAIAANGMFLGTGTGSLADANMSPVMLQQKVWV
eukprot:XP_001700620.1 predicted protein [Chlamydomonas reinhardtii]